MDFNAIEDRLKRTLSSLNGRYTDDIERGIIVNNDKDGNKTLFSASFGKSSISEVENRVLIILYNLASLKDNLKNCLEENGHDPRIVEVQINSSLHLQVLIDLVNEEKHGYPLTKTRRSLKDPIIKNVRQSLAVFPDSGAHGTLFFVTMDGDNGTIGGKSVMFIDADIYDSSGTHLFGLDELITNCYREWVTIANTYNCVASPFDVSDLDRIETPPITIQKIELEAVDTSIEYNIEVIGNTRCSYQYHELVNDEYRLIYTEGPMHVLFGTSNNQEDFKNEFEAYHDSLGFDTLKEVVDNFESSNMLQIGDFPLNGSKDFILEKGKFKIKAVTDPGDHKIVDKITASVSFVVRVSES